MIDTTALTAWNAANAAARAAYRADEAYRDGWCAVCESRRVGCTRECHQCRAKRITREGSA